MSIVEGFERKALFNITRAVALVCVTAFLVMIAGGVVYGVSVWQERVDTTVPAKEIVDPLKVVDVKSAEATGPTGTQPPTQQGPEESALAGYKIPFALQNYASGENGKIIRSQLDGVPEAERQAYIDELGAVVTAAEAQKVHVVDALNSYIQVKGDRYKAAAAKSAQKWETLKIVAYVTAAGLLLVALFSLVLVLLAIERNTRSLRHGRLESPAALDGERKALTA
ncbi:hypothetical protein [Burkholderia lata]|uniref:hypothetical protein n=1 Tax=Burkholderia lata (strain ATCC 17760 / DSM 23089 / LMG 22485 / NCIMB 9086 / R18194 / 383) TaxID=482957 RepID=UPI00145340EE|nr:hypothetical protein [Burkholderia lata]VWC34128.1 hypothetical protein BLA15816_06627 [Burkholderia lata]